MHHVRILLATLLGAVLLAAPAAHGASADVVVSQVYAGGGNNGATYQNDFVELFNRGTAAVDLSGWTIQYATAAGTSWSATALTGSIAPGRHYLVQLASAAAVGSLLPAPDATGTTNLAASGG
jgi:predicted extracellular nuclease